MRCYRSYVRFAVIGAALGAATASASAKPQATFELEKTSGTWKCKKIAAEPAAAAGKSALVELKAPEAVTPRFLENGVEIVPSGTNDNIYTLLHRNDGQPRTLTGLEVTIDSDRTKVDCEPGEIKLVEATGSPAGAEPGSGQKPAKAATPFDLSAGLWFREQGARALAELRGKGDTQLEDVRFLVHLPSGQPVYPFPSAVTEGKDMQVLVIVPTSREQAITLETSSCTAPSTFRTTFDEPDNKKQGRPHVQGSSFALVPVGQHFRCGAGDVSYTLKVEGATDALSTTKIRFRPRYHLAAIATLGWDFARRTSYAKETRAAADGQMMPFVSRQRERVGIEKMIGVQWMVGGVDYEAMRWYNHFANVFVATDPTAPLDNFVVGLALTPTGGLSVTAGLGFHRGSALDGVKLDEPFPGEGEIPVKPSWSEPGLGLSLGVALDSRVYDAIVKRFSR